MILAAADYAENKGDPPPELSLAFQCERWESLPMAGGVLNQPYGLLERMAGCVGAYRAIRGYNSADSTAEWANKNPDLYRTWQWVEQLRKDHYAR